VIVSRIVSTQEQIDPNLAQVMAAWDDLSKPIRVGIMAMVEAATPKTTQPLNEEVTEVPEAPHSTETEESL